MDTDRKALMDWIEAEKPAFVAFLRDFIRAKSPNPPGDTREVAAHVKRFLEESGLAYRVIAPQPVMPNIVANFESRDSGRHLVLNGHIDVFPVGDGFGWTRDPWGGEIVGGKIYGRGAADMKCGTSASIITYALLHRIKDQLKGKLTLTVVSDEETFGPWGARYLMEHHPEVHVIASLMENPAALTPFASAKKVRFGSNSPCARRVRMAPIRMRAAAPARSPCAWRRISKHCLRSAGATP